MLPLLVICKASCLHCLKKDTNKIKRMTGFSFDGQIHCQSLSLVWCFCFVDHCLSFCTFSFGHCVVSSSIYGFLLPLWYLQTLLNQNEINRYESLFNTAYVVSQNILPFTDYTYKWSSFEQWSCMHGYLR